MKRDEYGRRPAGQGAARYFYSEIPVTGWILGNLNAFRTQKRMITRGSGLVDINRYITNIDVCKHGIDKNKTVDFNLPEE